jgi:hypothetical protein
VDVLFLNKIQKKFKFYNIIHLPFVGKISIQYLVLSFNLFMAMWVGSIRTIHKCKVILRNFLLNGRYHNTTTKIS